MRMGNGLASFAGSLRHPSVVSWGLASELAEEPIVMGGKARQAEEKLEVGV
jgi:hypothetical protein